MSIFHASEICMAVMLALLPTGNYEIQRSVPFSGVMIIAFFMKIHWLV